MRRILFAKPGEQRRDVKPRCKLKGNIIKGSVSGSDHRVDGPEVPRETCIYAYIPFILKGVTKTVGCGVSHEYTNIHNVYSVQYYIQCTKTVYKSYFHKVFICMVKAVCIVVF